MAPTKTLLLVALLAAATTTCALDAESNNWILSKLFNSPTKQVATPQKSRLFGRKSKASSTKGESEGEQTYSTYLTAALGIFLAIGTWYLPIGSSNSADDNKQIINKKLSMDYSTCTESISDLETTIDSSSSDDDDSVEQQQKRRQLNKPPSGYGNFLSFISESSPTTTIVEPNEAEKKIAQVNQIKELMIVNEISNEKCNELFKLYDTKLEMLYKNLVRLKEKKEME